MRKNSDGQGWEAGQGEAVKFPDIMWRSLHLSRAIGEQLKSSEREVA